MDVLEIKKYVFCFFLVDGPRRPRVEPAKRLLDSRGIRTGHGSFLFLPPDSSLNIMDTRDNTAPPAKRHKQSHGHGHGHAVHAPPPSKTQSASGPHEAEEDAEASATATTTTTIPNTTTTTAKLPVTLLGGFLGAGKTTLLKHILETKHNESAHNESAPFKCAVIVNDMAELNVDKALIDMSALQQSDQVIAMQNGCVCCTLKGDLRDQMIELACTNRFDYMIVEASGISEPSEIAQLFSYVGCGGEHHDPASQQAQQAQGQQGQQGQPPQVPAPVVLLNEVACLDTCVTVVSAAEFFENFQLTKLGKSSAGARAWPKLLIEQIEYSNIVIINKTDLVTKQQLVKIREHIMVLNPEAKILQASHSVVDVANVVNTQLYDASKFHIEDLKVDYGEEAMPACCQASVGRGEAPCCKRARTFTTTLSEVILGNKKLPKTRHEARFGIRSFLYKARRPFHPHRFMKFIQKYFIFVDEDEEEEDDEEEEEEEDEDEDEDEGEKEKDKDEEDKDEDDKGPGEGSDIDAAAATAATEKLARQQQEAVVRQRVREDELGFILRSKGFIWTAHTNDLMGLIGQAGNVVTIDCQTPWNALNVNAWKGTGDEKKKLRKDFVAPWGDRRQEIVFIGYEMKHCKVQGMLDDCLLTDEEFALGIDGWKATMGDIFLFGDGHGTGTRSE